MSFLKVEGHTDLFRDENSGAIININKQGVSAARKRKLERRQKEKEFEELKNEVSDIKIMLTKIIENIDG